MSPISPRSFSGLQPRGLRLEAAAEYVGVGKTKFLEWVEDGRMPSGRLVDGCRLWDRLRLDEAFEALMDDGSATPRPGTRAPRTDWSNVA